MIHEPFTYSATVVEIYDGDTVTLDVDLGFNIRFKNKFRLYGIDAWEVRGEERERGLVARDWLRQVFPVDSVLFIKTEKDQTGKYGRYLVTMYRKTPQGFVNINKELVRLGHAEKAEY